MLRQSLGEAGRPFSDVLGLQHCWSALAVLLGPPIMLRAAYSCVYCVIILCECSSNHPWLLWGISIDQPEQVELNHLSFSAWLHSHAQGGHVQTEIGGRTVRVGGMAKGSGHDPPQHGHPLWLPSPQMQPCRQAFGGIFSARELPTPSIR